MQILVQVQQYTEVWSLKKLIKLFHRIFLNFAEISHKFQCSISRNSRKISRIFCSCLASSKYSCCQVHIQLTHRGPGLNAKDHDLDPHIDRLDPQHQAESSFMGSFLLILFNNGTKPDTVHHIDGEWRLQIF